MKKGIARIIAVGGGKGGVGKSLISLALACDFARRGRRVILADLDLGAANLHTYLGITGRTPSLADFISGKTAHLSDLLIDTAAERVRLISGSQFRSGAANPTHGVKLKLLRHLRDLDADLLILDLGAGVHFNTLDFFGSADLGVIVTMPEPGAVMNAYGFLKAALFRKIEHVFKKHPAVGALLREADEDHESDGDLNLEIFCRRVNEIDPSLSPLLNEIREGFRPFLVVNRMLDAQSSILVRNLLCLCRDRLGVELTGVGDVPDAPEIRNYLLHAPDFLTVPAGKRYAGAVSRLADRMDAAADEGDLKRDFTEEELEELQRLIDSLAEDRLGGSTRSQWKLRLFFKPAAVAKFLISKGIDRPFFHR
jgi:flagellar biosynthesis protein FlhG